MTKFYKGQRISELLKQIEKLSRALENSYDDYENEALTERSMEARATLAIAKAKLTALQGE